MDKKLLTLRDLVKVLGVGSPQSIRRWVKNGRFPRPIKTGPRVTRWLNKEVTDWLQDKMENRK